jgi:hypothetical protein
MLVVFPTFAGDIAQLHQLLIWCAHIGQPKSHTALICADSATPFDKVIHAKELAEKVFNEVHITSTDKSVNGWPQGANYLFWTASKYAEEHKLGAFLWVETDCVPLMPEWLDRIWADYHFVGAMKQSLFMGHIYQSNDPMLPGEVMSGIAVYPQDTATRIPFLERGRAWDMDAAEIMVQNGRHTNLIFHFWGEKGLAPTFVRERTPNSPRNALTMDDIPKECVLFHRCKNSSLRRLIRPDLFPKERIKPVFNVSPYDLPMAIEHAHWLRQMDRKWNHVAVIAHDPSCSVPGLNQFEAILRECFEDVETCVYPRPSSTYPGAANWAWKSVARHMARGTSPWFWFEADACALTCDWIDKIQKEYDECGKSWMGPVVDGLNHMNGTSVYPADAAKRMPRAMACQDHQAFDMEGRLDTLHDRHDASHLLHHCWTKINGACCPVGGGDAPIEFTPEQLKSFLPKTAVFFHRAKDNSILTALRTGTYVHQ